MKWNKYYLQIVQFFFQVSTTVHCSFVPLRVKLLSGSVDIHKMLLLIKKHQKNTTVCKCYAKVFESMSQTKRRILSSDVYIESKFIFKRKGAERQNMRENYEKKVKIMIHNHSTVVRNVMKV